MGGYRGGGDLEGRIRSGGGVVTAQRWYRVIGGPGVGRYGDVGVGGGLGGGGYPGWVGIDMVGT